MHERVAEQSGPIGPPAADGLDMAGLSSLTAGCAHHLNNIVTAITTAADVALEHIDDDTEAGACLTLIRDEAGRAADLVASLALFGEEYQGVREAQDFAALVEETVGTLRRTLPKEITVDYSGPEAGVTVSGDSRQLRRMIMSLATNAHEAMPDGGKLTIELTIEDDARDELPPGFPTGDYAKLTVTDTGGGMSPDVSDQVFHPFFTTKPTGSGVGLSMSEVHGIARSHSGHVEVRSAVDAGTTITVLLPAIPSPTSTRRRPRPDCEGGTEKLLLVDDDPGVLKVTSMVLDILGYEVVTATNGVEALKVFAVEHEDTSLVLADLVMPEMDGAELCEELSRQYPGTKVLMVSGSAPGDPMPMLSDKGVVGFLRKPFTRHELATAIREALAHTTETATATPMTI